MATNCNLYKENIEFYKRDLRLIISRKAGDKPGEPDGFFKQNDFCVKREGLQFGQTKLMFMLFSMILIDFY